VAGDANPIPRIITAELRSPADETMTATARLFLR